MFVGGTTNWKTFADVKAQNLDQDKAEYFTAKGTVVFMKKENCMYTVSEHRLVHGLAFRGGGASSRGFSFLFPPLPVTQSSSKQDGLCRCVS